MNLSDLWKTSGNEVGFVEDSLLGYDGGPSFSIDPAGFVLFGDTLTHIRRVEVFRNSFSESEADSSSRTLSWFLPEAVRAILIRSDKERDTAFSLAGILTRPVPSWRTGCFHGIFLDRFMDSGYGVDNSVHGSLRALSFLGSKVLKSNYAISTLISDDDKSKIQSVLSGLQASVDLARKISTAAKQGNSKSIFSLLNFHREKLAKLSPGDFLLVPVGVQNENEDVLDAAVLLYFLDDENLEVTIVNPCSDETNAFHSIKPSALPCKKRYLTSFSLGSIPKNRVFDTSWWLWLFVFRCTHESRNCFDAFYSVLGWLVNEPFDVAIDRWEENAGIGDDNDNLQPSDFRSSPMSSTGHHKVVTESFYYLCRRTGLSRASIKTFLTALRLEMSECVRKDLLQLHAVSRSERKIIQIGVQQMCFNVLKFCENLSGDNAKSMILLEFLKSAQGIGRALDTKQEANEYAACEAVLQLGDGYCSDGSALFPLFENFLSGYDLEGLGGGETDWYSGLAEDLIHDKLERVKTFEDGLDTIRQTLRLMFIIEANKHRLRLFNRLILLIGENIFTHVLPAPLGPLTRKDTKKKCIWNCTQAILAQQKEAIHLLSCLSFHIASAASGVEWDEHFHMSFTCVLGCIAAIADAILRAETKDKIGGVTKALNSGSYYVSSDLFEAQSSVFPVFSAKLLNLRAAILDYFR